MAAVREEEIRSLSPGRDSIPALSSIIGGPTTTGYQTAPREGIESSRSSPGVYYSVGYGQQAFLNYGVLWLTRVLSFKPPTSPRLCTVWRQSHHNVPLIRIATIGGQGLLFELEFLFASPLAFAGPALRITAGTEQWDREDSGAT